MTGTITSKGQITIPIKIRKRFGWKAGQKLRFDEKAPFLKAVPDFDVDAMKALIGSRKGAWGNKTSGKWLTETRGPDLDGKPRR
jgi:AbrB family looped-hinge helix DNA binding protein